MSRVRALWISLMVVSQLLLAASFASAVQWDPVSCSIQAGEAGSLIGGCSIEVSAQGLSTAPSIVAFVSTVPNKISQNKTSPAKVRFSLDFDFGKFSPEITGLESGRSVSLTGVSIRRNMMPFSKKSRGNLFVGLGLGVYQTESSQVGANIKIGIRCPLYNPTKNLGPEWLRLALELGTTYHSAGSELDFFNFFAGFRFHFRGSD